MELVERTPIGHPDLARYHHSLGKGLRLRYMDSGDLVDLEASLKNNQVAVDLTPEGHPDRAKHLRGLAAPFRARYRSSGELKDLEAALHINQEAVKLTPKGHPDRARYLYSLGVSFEDRHEKLGHQEDLKASIQTKQEAVDLTSEGHHSRAGYLHSLASSLGEYYQKFGDLEYLEAALQIQQEALELTPRTHPDRAVNLNNLAGSVTQRYRRLGNLDDVEASVKLSQEAVELTPKVHGNRADHLQTLSIVLTDRYRRLGDLKDLEAALHANQEVVDSTPHGHPDRARFLHGLSVSYGDLFRRLRNLKDVKAALAAAQEAVNLTPKEHPERAGRLQALATGLRQHHEFSENLKDLDDALHADKEAVELTPKGHPDREGLLPGLGLSFRNRYIRVGDLKDLEAAVQAFTEAVDLTPEGHQNRASHLQSLAVCLKARYHRLRDIKDLRAALQMQQQAVDLTPETHPDRALLLQNLALIYSDQYREFRKPKDLVAICTYYSESFKIPSLDPEISWEMALQWASFAETILQTSDCVPAYMYAFGLLPEILWLGHSIPVRHDAIRRLEVAQVTSTAIQICMYLSNLIPAVEIMEQGLATVFQQMLQLKTDMKGINPSQAQDLQNLSSQLYSGTSDNRMTLVNERNGLLEDIRKRPSLEYFLLPKPYKALCHASQGGPVVILNSHRYHCDGIIILNPTSEPAHVSFPNVTLDLLKSHREELKELLSRCNVRFRGESSASRLFGHREQVSSKSTQECFRDILDWLWTHVVAPVYQVLASHGIYYGRLWWLPTGAFTELPLHASPPTDQFIHSYTATLGSLLDAHSKRTSSIVQKFTVVGVTHTGPGRVNLLKGVEQEVKKITSIIKEHHDVQCLEGEQATVDAVGLQIQDCSWAHLACHGRQDLVHPTKSHLQLYGGILDLETILRMPFSNAQVVFLAACQTAMGDAELMNESFHLGGGFIAAGFRGAIGTMWSMNDEDGPLVAEIVYSHLFRNDQQPQASEAAEALQLAVKELKQKKVPYERWIPFIHMGI
ncbi:CHAT domain-containing protein [Mycena vulgaris]|nr:CHAT domain-containing protein [Mycena vulgaris]